jgi:hypothetical protein
MARPTAGRTSNGLRARLSLLLVVAAAASGGAAWLVLSGHARPAGLAALAAVAGLVAGEASGEVRPKFARRLLDRAYEACVLAPVAWVARAGSPRLAVLALAGIGLSYLASYERARGQSLGYRQSEVFGYRATGGVILAVGLLTGWMEAALWLFDALMAAASGARAANIVAQERRVGAEPG